MKILRILSATRPFERFIGQPHSTAKVKRLVTDYLYKNTMMRIFVKCSSFSVITFQKAYLKDTNVFGESLGSNTFEKKITGQSSFTRLRISRQISRSH